MTISELIEKLLAFDDMFVKDWRWVKDLEKYFESNTDLDVTVVQKLLALGYTHNLIKPITPQVLYRENKENPIPLDFGGQNRAY